VAHGAPAPGRRPPGSLARRRCSARPLPGSLQPARSAQLTALAARPTQLIETHRHARLAALHPLDHRLVARLSLEADRHGPSFKHVLQRSKVLGLGGHCQRLGDLLDEPLLVSGDAPGAAARSGRRRSVRPRSCPASAALVRCLWLQFAERMIRRPASMRHLHVLPCNPGHYPAKRTQLANK
jgi:hypothetical protein